MIGERGGFEVRVNLVHDYAGASAIQEDYVLEHYDVVD